MTISKERLNEIALEVAKGINPYTDLHKSEFIYFAHALLKRVKSECEVVGYRFHSKTTTKFDSWPHGGNWKKLIVLPLVEGD